MTLLSGTSRLRQPLPESVDLVVVGAHLSGQPLNDEITDVGGRLVGPVATAPSYRLFALATSPPKPGLLRVTSGGAVIIGERWQLPTAGFGAFVAALTSPMSIGSLELDDGSWVSGFLVEAVGTAGAIDITAGGGWVAHLRTRD